MLRTVAALAAVLFALSGSARAQIFYVDAVQGDDMNDGSSPGTAFRTITRGALAAQSGSALSQVHVAPGVYDTSIGEVFPIVLVDRVGVFGPDPSGGAAAIVVPGVGVDGFHVTDPGGQPQARRLSVQDADRAFVVAGSFDLRSIDVRRCRIALDLSAATAGSTFIAGSSISGGEVGVLVGARSASVNSTVIENATVGIRYVPDQLGILALNVSTIRNCRVGVQVESATADATVRLIESAIVECTTGVEVAAASTGAPAVDMERATIAGNGTGVSIGAGLDPTSEVARSIIAANGIGFAPSAFLPSVLDSIVDDGSATGFGVLAVDPLFVDPASGDYTLQRTSPAVDRTIVPAQVEAFEPDGNFDAMGGSDWGAFERLTLTALTDAPIGGTVTFEAEGEPGSFGFGMFDPTPFGGAATLTQYGALIITGPDIQRVAPFRFPTQSPFATWSVNIPNDPALEGTVWVAQSLVRTSASASGGALSNAVGFRIE